MSSRQSPTRCSLVDTLVLVAICYHKHKQQDSISNKVGSAKWIKPINGESPNDRKKNVSLFFLIIALDTKQF